MGLVEGLTEYIPVSSTGHLILAGAVLRIPEEIQKSFDVFIQAGAILAVVCAFPHRFAGLVRSSSVVGGFHGARGWGLLALTTTPAAVAGLLAHRWIERHAFQPTAVAVGLALGAAAMLWLEHRRVTSRVQNLDGMGWREALGIGLFQCLALWPGVSRSAATILGGIALGLDRKTATEYSFFAAVPVLTLAAVYAMVRDGAAVTAAWASFFATGLAVAFVSGLASIRFLMRFLSRHRMDAFAAYRLALAAAVLWFSR